MHRFKMGDRISAKESKQRTAMEVCDGEQRGKNRINKLNCLLLADDRQEELLRSFSDRKLQQKLLEEYAL